MTTAIIRSEVPVVVYVTPAGARAASAGFFLLMAADIGAMAPGTNAGAAHPVAIGRESGQQEAKGGDPAIAKAAEDAAALVRSLAAARGRSVEWAEKAVRESLSYSADEARGHRLVELVAGNRGALLAKLDGATVRRFDGRAQVLRLAGAELVRVNRTLAERVSMVIADPQVAYLLLMLGFLGLMVELMSPGAIVPGVGGGISMLLALYAFSVLPVNWAAFLLIGVGVGLLVAEAFVTSYGLLTLGGAVSLVLGSFMLINSPAPGWRIGWELIIPTVVVLAAASLFLMSRAWRLRRAKAKTGLDAMVGGIGELTNGIERGQGEGRIFVHGEYWTAIADEPVPGGAKVRVEGVEGSRLRVAPVNRVPT